MDGQPDRFSHYKSREEQAEEINYFCCNINTWTQDFKTNFEPIPGNNLTFTDYVQRKLLDRRNNQLKNSGTTERTSNEMLRTSTVNNSKSRVENLQVNVDGDVRPDPQEPLKRFIQEEQPEREKVNTANENVNVESQQPSLHNRPVDANQEFILREKKHANELKKMGNVAFKLEDFSTAINYYTEAIKYDPENAILYGNRAQAYLNLGQNIKAIADCDIALNFDPTYIKALNRRALAKIQNGDLDSGRTDLLLTTKLEPKNKDAINLLADLNARLKPQFKVDGCIEPKIKSPLTNKRAPPTKTIWFTKPVDNKQLPKEPKVFPKVILPIEKPVHLHAKRPVMSIRVNFVGGEAGAGGGDNDMSHPEQQGTHTLAVKTHLDNLMKSRTFRLGVPCPGKTAAQFTSDITDLADHPETLALYLKQMRAEDFGVFEKSTMEYFLLAEILDVLVWEFLPRKWDVMEILIGLAAFVDPIDLLICFATEKEKAALKKLLTTQKAFVRDYYAENFGIRCTKS